MFIAQIDNGKMMYLTECLGASFFWSPSRVCAYSKKTREDIKKIAIKHLPDNVLEEAVEIVVRCLFYVDIFIASNEERWFVTKEDEDEYSLDNDWVIAHGFETREEALVVGEEICGDFGKVEGMLSVTIRLPPQEKS